MANRPQRSRRGRPEFGEEQPYEDTVVKLYRCATVVKGGRRFSFGALVVVGDRRGQVGYGYGKANEVPPAVEKGIKLARRNLFGVALRGTTIPHRVIGRFGSSRVIMLPAADGTGVIAGAAPRAVLELAGIKNVLTKCYGSTSPKNLVKATIDGLKQLRTRAMVEALRGVTLDLPAEPEPQLDAQPTVDLSLVRQQGAARRRGRHEDDRRPVAPPAAPQAPAAATPDTSLPATPEQPAEGTANEPG